MLAAGPSHSPSFRLYPSYRYHNGGLAAALVVSPQGLSSIIGLNGVRGLMTGNLLFNLGRLSQSKKNFETCSSRL